MTCRWSSWPDLCRHRSMSKPLTYRHGLRGRFTVNGLQRCAGTTTLQRRLRQAFNGFNLVVGDVTSGEVAFVSNRGEQAPAFLRAGAYGISNGRLDAGWPKACRPAAVRSRRPSLHTSSTRDLSPLRLSGV